MQILFWATVIVVTLTAANAEWGCDLFLMNKKPTKNQIPAIALIDNRIFTYQLKEAEIIGKQLNEFILKNSPLKNLNFSANKKMILTTDQCQFITSKGGDIPEWITDSPDTNIGIIPIVELVTLAEKDYYQNFQDTESTIRLAKYYSLAARRHRMQYNKTEVKAKYGSIKKALTQFQNLPLLSSSLDFPLEEIINTAYLQKSIKLFEEVQNTAPLNFSIFPDLVYNYLALGERDKAKELLRKIILASFIEEKDDTQGVFGRHSNKRPTYFSYAFSHLIKLLDKTNDATEIEELYKMKAYNGSCPEGAHCD